MRIILDENVPQAMCEMPAPRDVTTVQRAGYRGLENGDLLDKLEGEFDVFVTADKNLRYQQNLKGRTIAIIELPTNRLPALRAIQQRVASAIDSCKPSSYLTLES